MLEAPYVLVTGLGPVHALSPTPRTTMLVASDRGLLEVNGEGAATVLAEDGAYAAVATHKGRLHALRGEVVRSTAFPPPAVPTWTERPWPGARDLQSTCGDALFVADGAGIGRWSPGGEPTRFGPQRADIRALTIDVAAPCDGVIAVTDDAVLRVQASGVTPLASGVDGLRAAALDARGRVWVVAGDPPVLGTVGPGGVDARARHLGETGDLAFGFGGLFPSANAYLGTAAGTLDYARVVLD